ncbi:MAG: respiratory chain complex I subunit 1 family protein [bacterium]
MDNLLDPLGWAMAVVQVMLFVLGAPLLVGWVRKLKAALENRRGASVIQPYRDLYKLFGKEVMVADTTTIIFRMAPYIVFAATALAAGVTPLIATSLPLAAVADIIVLIGFLALGRFFLTLAGMDVGTAFGGMGASRELLVSSMAEPAALMAIFTLAMSAHTTNLSFAIDNTLASEIVLRPSLLFSLLALTLVAVAETGRIPVDNPTTHLELTMLHEAMILEYSGRHLALMEWAAYLKLMLYGVLISNIFFPWGIATDFTARALAIGVGAIVLKLMVLAALLALLEAVLAKMRLFKAPQFLNFAFLLALLGMISHVLLETRV